ncbi:MAG: LapA family protein [cyanobacterium endosymbiont of Rhopalodia musculus]|uniref:LapA family protein n=1 Tax=cyanobacterium endosymbiont of Epithemia clementina EcSB TaxID=3034674 RepID=UPI002481955B|nr:LapA family protein [cyanobacterium endosymbiont of Epithemia clementina EcSB]WGT67591.1 LapA family protein [cyanobacterium endosymbiont of Epithemia clementina EcSB]
MKSLTYLMTTIMIAFWLVIVAIFSIQNITEISLNFLIFKSIKLPIGVLLSFCVGGGMILGALVTLLWEHSKYLTKRHLRKTSQEVDDF